MVGMSKKGVLLYNAVWIALGLSLWPVNGAGNSVLTRPHYPLADLSITHADGTKVSFTLEVANTDNEQSDGLMFVRNLSENAGMIFVYHRPQEVAYWMKNTLIPLDMLFVRPGGKIGLIAANAKPLDLTRVSSQGPVAAVIEIKGGQAKKDGIVVGDKVGSFTRHLGPVVPR